MKWVIVANSNQYRIYDYQRKEQILELLQVSNHPENKLKDSEVLSDRQGRYNTNHAAHGAYSQAVDPFEAVIDHFARDLAHTLEQGRNKQAYNELILIIPPDMEGKLLHHLNKHIKPFIKHVIQKNMIHCNDAELLEYLHEHL